MDGTDPAWACGMATTPFWHEAAPPEPEDSARPPETVDALVIGAGFTGLGAALAFAEAGWRAAVLDAGPPGAGASTRNGGMIGWGHRARLETLAKRHGEAGAKAILGEAVRSLAHTRALIERLPVDARHRRTGRFLAAASPTHFERLAKWAETEAPVLGMETRVVPRAEQSAEIETGTYHGGLLFPDHGSLHPGLMHRGMLEAARGAGAHVIGRCPVTAVAGEPGAWRVSHAHGETRAREIVYAANGYHGGRRGPFRAFARRLVPCPSFIVATEPLGQNRIRSLMPGMRSYVDTRSTHSYYRPCPDGERLIWGGRASLTPMPERRSAARLRDHLLSVFPGLEDVGLTHSWTGTIAFTADGVPHLGRVGGVWHASGYNGSGVAMAPYLGWQVARRAMGEADGATGFDAAPFAAQPHFAGAPFALRALELWYRWRDWREGVAPIRRRS